MTMQVQVDDFKAECDALFKVFAGCDEDSFQQATQFKSWTLNDILVHLYFWNRGADLALTNPDQFTEMISSLGNALGEGRLREYENAHVSERGRRLLEVWQHQYQEMCIRWSTLDPKTRVKWAGPDMSVRTSISARQMETWAHGQAIFDLLGKTRLEADRIKNIAILGANAFGWSHKVHNLEVPEQMPRLILQLPSGDKVELGSGSDTISGSAVEFCQVVTQTRNIADTSLKVTGEVAHTWMDNAQCFAGPPEMPPKPGARFPT